MSAPTAAVRQSTYWRDDNRCADQEYAAARIEATNEGQCWHWTGPIDASSYGRANRPGRYGVGAHRFVYELYAGPVPAGMVLDHECHNRDASCPGGTACLHRRCVNPAHLAPIEPGENSKHGKTRPALNLAKERCPEGHEYDAADARGWRKCSTCDRSRQEAARRTAGVPLTRRNAAECAHGHPWCEETTRWSKGNRYCLLCDRDRRQRAKETRRG